MQSSAVEFMASMRLKCIELMKTADITDIDPSKKYTGMPNYARAKVIERETQEAAELIRQGKGTKEAAEAIGITRPMLITRLRTRGLSVYKLRTHRA